MPVRAGMFGVLGEAGELLAHSQGYFVQQDLAIEFVKVDASTVVTALTSGQIDVAGLGAEAGLFNTIQRGVDLRIVAALAASEPQANGAFLVVRKELIESGKVRAYADLKGLKIGIPAPASSAEYVVARTMEAGGLALNDAHLMVLTFPAMVTALDTQALDVAVLPEPLATVAVQNGSGVKWKGIADVVPGFQQTVVAYSPQFAARRDLATRWMAAYLRGVRDYNDAFRKNIHRSQTVDALAGDLSIKPTLFDDMGFMHIHPDGKVNLARMEELMRWYVKMGYLSSPVDLARSVDPSFAEAAVSELGPYQ
jgi:NitT/TauT family transport system substrate-binding protein